MSPAGYAVAQWLGIRLQMMGVVTVGGVAFIAMLEHHFNTVDPSMASSHMIDVSLCKAAFY